MLAWRRASGELRLLGLGEQQSHESCGEEQKGHQQNGHGAVGVHQLAEDDVPCDGCHAAHSREEAQSRGAVEGRKEKGYNSAPKLVLFRYVGFFFLQSMMMKGCSTGVREEKYINV